MADRDLVNILNAINENLQRISGRTPYLIDGAVTGKSFKTIYITASGTTFSAITGVNGTNYLTLWNLTGKTLSTGFFSADSGDPIVSITATAGQAIGYE